MTNPNHEATESEASTRAMSRREALHHSGRMSAGVAAGLAILSAPAALATVFKTAAAQGGLTQPIIDVLNFALTLEYLEDEFYRRGLGASGLIPASDRTIFEQISKHESAHVALLKSTIGSTAVSKPTFDFSGGSGSGTGPFGNPFANYATFQALAQAFEDTGVRAYKGQAGALMSNDGVLTVALQIHSVEARHAAMVRRLRGSFQDTGNGKGWITTNATDIAGAEAVYAGEQLVTQGGVNLVTAGLGTAAQVSEAFDEPLDKDAVLAIAGLFIVAS